MPQTPENMSTMELLNELQQYILNPGMQYYNELLNREIKEEDDDDTEQHRGGVRPYHAPLV